MFQFKRGRLYVSELSFCIPENSYINSELTTDNSIGFISFDTKTIWYYVIGEGPDGIEEGMWFDQEEFSESYAFNDPISPIELNGLKGHYHMYATKVHQFYDLQVEIERKEKSIVELYLSITTEKDIRQYIESSEFQETFYSIRREL